MSCLEAKWKKSLAFAFFYVFAFISSVRKQPVTQKEIKPIMTCSYRERVNSKKVDFSTKEHRGMKYLLCRESVEVVST